MGSYLLTPPTCNEYQLRGRLFARYPIASGVALLVTGSDVVEAQVPSMAAIAAADHAFLGGHIYTVDDAVAAILTAAGYAACLEALVVDNYSDTYSDIY